MQYKKPYLIAEAGCNHKGDMGIAYELIKTAAEYCGADAVKFQKRNNRELLTPEQYGAPQKQSSIQHELTWHRRSRVPRKNDNVETGMGQRPRFGTAARPDQRQDQPRRGTGPCGRSWGFIVPPPPEMVSVQIRIRRYHEPS